ncbi:CDP-alcohol phosphatidyltransferase family protein [Elongatibacter sediminis]|uniref:CDP-alcohol phosphatidyltransferase family protein n=1 Tax=Elongatibacter sediminis TaxID=3119006 RepID=A0AAW9RDZ7_9GAMM
MTKSGTNEAERGDGDGNPVPVAVPGTRPGADRARTCVLVLDESPVSLWGLGAAERLKRQLRALDPSLLWIDSVESLPAQARVLLLNGGYLFDARALAGLLARDGVVLIDPRDGRSVAACVGPGEVVRAAAAVGGESQEPPAGLQRLAPDDLDVFDEALRSARAPLLEPVSPERARELENLLYGNAYRGITDLVTKFVWPRPARAVVHLCARWRATPNHVTTWGFVLVLAACWLFWNGHYFAGLAAGWLMTFLDTVDGKLARVTVQSSQFGHLFDHAIDLIHPPFWYVFWGLSLAPPVAIAVWGVNLEFAALCWILVAAYVGGRIVEGLFPLLGDCSVFTWRPFDAWFRLVTARRNPCLILLTGSALAGHPEWGFKAVVVWSVLTTGVLIIRLLQGLAARLSGGPLTSWLSEDGAASGPHATTFRVFAGTRSAYGG